jgi:hypothetical protein
MRTFSKLKDFEKRFDTMGVDELKLWQVYWTQRTSPGSKSAEDSDEASA